jgi:ABC-2 type transport system ATP-binding protein
VHVAGVDVQEDPRRAHQHMGYLSDFFGLYETLTVAQCLQYAAESQGLSRQAASQRVHAVAEQLALSNKLGNATRNLSRGQRQRVAIGQAIIHQPQVLLLDEPASGLDPEARSSLSALFRQLHAQGMTLVVSSHILSELDEYCTHILSIREGRISSHEALNAAPHATGTGAQAGELVMQIELAAPLADAATALAGYRLVDMRAHGSASHALWVALPANNAAARVQLLQQLVAHGAPVLSYQEARTSLQERYQQSLQAVPQAPAMPVDIFAKEQA